MTQKEFKDTTLGKILGNYAESGKIGEMNHSLDTGTIAKVAIGILVVGIALFAIKKFLFKL